MSYTADLVREAVRKDFDRLFESYSTGRPENWIVNQRTKDVISISVWLREELTRVGVDDLGRRTQEGFFNRYSRSDDDLFELAAQLMNDALAGNIDRFRKTHRRWG